MFTYKVKIINPSKKSDVVTRHLHQFNSKFSSVINLHTKLIEEFKENVPSNINFAVGYYEGQRHAKIVIATDDDLKAMYSNYPRGEITLWCNGRNEDSSVGRSKRKRDQLVASTFQAKEEQIEQIFLDLKEKHVDKYDMPKLRLWARMISSQLHESFEEPPNIPAFSDSTPKKIKQDFSSALSGAAVAFAKVLTKKDDAPPDTSISPSSLALTEVRMKNFEQLRYIKQLHEDHILTDEEFEEQKGNILSAIRKLK